MEVVGGVLRYLLLAASIALITTAAVYAAAVATSAGLASTYVHLNPAATIASPAPGDRAAFLYVTENVNLLQTLPRPPAGFEVRYHATVVGSLNNTRCRMYLLTVGDAKLFEKRAEQLLSSRGVLAATITLLAGWGGGGRPTTLEAVEGVAPWDTMALLLRDLDSRSLSIVDCSGERQPLRLPSNMSNVVVMVYLEVPGNTSVPAKLDTVKLPDGTSILRVLITPSNSTVLSIVKGILEARGNNTVRVGGQPVTELLRALASRVQQLPHGGVIAYSYKPLVTVKIDYSLAPTPMQVARVAGGFLLAAAFIAYDRQRRPELYRLPRFLARLLRRRAV